MFARPTGQKPVKHPIRKHAEQFGDPTHLIAAAIQRSGLPADVPIDEVLMGQVLQAGVGEAPARQAALKAGLPVTTSATTINPTGPLSRVATTR